jgi:hypothetical protein
LVVKANLPFWLMAIQLAAVWVVATAQKVGSSHHYLHLRRPLAQARTVLG